MPPLAPNQQNASAHPAWLDARKKWEEFLHRIEYVRSKLHCSFSNAWFRGHQSSSHALLPAILRQTRGTLRPPAPLHKNPRFSRSTLRAALQAIYPDFARERFGDRSEQVRQTANDKDAIITS